MKVKVVRYVFSEYNDYYRFVLTNIISFKSQKFQESQSEDEPHILKHLVFKPVLQQIHEVAATQEEIRLIERYLAQNPGATLRKAEKFLYDLSCIPQFNERVTCMMYENRFTDLLDGIENTLLTFKSTCHQLTSKIEIQNIFAIILTLGKSSFEFL